MKYASGDEKVIYNTVRKHSSCNQKYVYDFQRHLYVYMVEP